MKVTEKKARIRNGVLTDEVHEFTEDFENNYEALMYLGYLLPAVGTRGRLWYTISVTIEA